MPLKKRAHRPLDSAWPVLGSGVSERSGAYPPTWGPHCPDKRGLIAPHSGPIAPMVGAPLPHMVALLPHCWPPCHCPAMPQLTQFDCALVAPNRPHCPTRGARTPQGLWGNRGGNRDLPFVAAGGTPPSPRALLGSCMFSYTALKASFTNPFEATAPMGGEPWSAQNGGLGACR